MSRCEDYIDGSAAANDLMRVLFAAWPAVATVTLDDLQAIGSTHDMREFLGAIEALNDDGMLCFEALVVGTAGPRLIDASLTARGRNAFRLRNVNG